MNKDDDDVRITYERWRFIIAEGRRSQRLYKLTMVPDGYADYSLKHKGSIWKSYFW